jgi:hypothetical protein
MWLKTNAIFTKIQVRRKKYGDNSNDQPFATLLGFSP